MQIPRRLFLKACAATSLFALSPTHWHQVSAATLNDAFDEIRNNLLQLVNEERAVEKVPLLKMDDLATKVATAHAQEMARHAYASHWNRDGLKAYHRYSLAGGYHYTKENVSAADNTWSNKLADLKQDTSYLHVRLYSEKPPNDGHRKAILAPQNTHVGFGIAVEELRLRMVELFVSKYVELKVTKLAARPQETVYLTGNTLNREYFLNSIEVFYEPLPKPPEIEWLREPRPYELPLESDVLAPKLPKPFFYPDRKPGRIDIEITGQFRTPIHLYKKEPGLYTVVCWIQKNRAVKPIPVSELCIRAE